MMYMYTCECKCMQVYSANVHLYVPSILGLLLGLGVSSVVVGPDKGWVVLTESSKCGEELRWEPGDSS